jgi:hypothetical protein
LKSNRDIYEKFNKQYYETNKHTFSEDESYYDLKCLDVRFPSDEHKSSEVTISYLVK